MAIYNHGTDYVREWFGHRMKKNLITKRATCFSGGLCFGGFTLFAYSRKVGLPPECIYSGLAAGLTAMAWLTVIAKIRRGYEPLPEVQFEGENFLDMLGDDEYVTIDGENATDRLMEILRRGDKVLPDVRRNLQMHSRDLGNLIEVMEVGTCPSYTLLTTILYNRMLTDMFAAIRKNEMDVPSGEDLDNLPIIDFDTRPPASRMLLKKIGDVFLDYMYSVERLRFGLKRQITPKFIGENNTSERSRQAIKMMMTYPVPKTTEETVELVQNLRKNVFEKLPDAGHPV